jgi:hypothetical protein
MFHIRTAMLRKRAVSKVLTDGSPVNEFEMAFRFMEYLF